MCNSSLKEHKILGRRMNLAQGINPRKRIGISTTIMQCSNCGLIYPNPLPIPENFIDLYRVAPDKYWSPDYLRLSDNYFEYEIKRCKKIINFKPGFRALDIGIGIGKCTIALQRAGFDSYGVEPSESFYNMAIELGIKKDRLKLTSIEEVEYYPDFFDFINFSAVLEHLQDPSYAIKKAIKWLKSAGIMHITVPSASWIISRIGNLYYRLIGTDYVTNTCPMRFPYHIYEFSLKSFEKNAKINNFRIIFYEFYSWHPFRLGFLNKPLLAIMKLTNTGSQISLWLKKC